MHESTNDWRARDGESMFGDAPISPYSCTEQENTPPAAPSSPDLDAASDTGLSDTDNSTSDDTPTLSGTADAGSTVKLLVDGVVKDSATATGGNYSITTGALSLGNHSLEAVAEDAAGNASDPSGALGVEIVRATACHTATNRIGGTELRNSLTGTAAGDMMLGLGGNDKMRGLGGNDCLSGGVGNDSLTGDAGDDEILGGEGIDRISTGPGQDIVLGGAGDDNVNSVDRAGIDRIDCGAGTRDSAVVNKLDEVVGCERVVRR